MISGDNTLLRLARFSTALLLMVPLQAASLGLGDLHLESALNEPLDARIRLDSLGQTQLDEVAVGLASRELFERAGLERPDFLSDLQFSVESDDRGAPVVMIRSGKPIAEPFLDFLIEVNWPNGRLLREYTALLDPPVRVEESPRPITAAVAGGSAASVAAVPADGLGLEGAEPPRGSGPATDQAGAQITGEGTWTYGPVARSATLWSIAQDFQSLSSEYSTEQIMLALVRENPEAFYNGNVNELKAGHVLRIEDPSTVALLSRAEAAAEYRRQTEQWMDARQGRAGDIADRPLGETARGAPDTPAAPVVVDAGPRLRLSAPDAVEVEELIGGTNEGEQMGDEAQRLRQELALALESSEAARQENVELRERLAALEEQIGSMQRLIALREDSLAALQAGATAADAPASAGGSDRAAWTALLSDPLILGAGSGGLLLLALLGWLVSRRRQLIRAEADELAAVTPAEVLDEELAEVTAAEAEVEAPEKAGESRTTVENAAAALATDGFGGSAGTIEASEDEIDVLSEADVYLAYRRFDKARELLGHAIQADPERVDLVLKLLEVHAAAGDAEAFVAEARALRGGLGEDGSGVWDKVVVMGSRVAPGHELFTAEAEGDGGRAAPSTIDELDLDSLDLPPPEVAGEAEDNPFMAIAQEDPAAGDADRAEGDQTFPADMRDRAASGDAGDAAAGATDDGLGDVVGEPVAAAPDQAPEVAAGGEGGEPLAVASGVESEEVSGGPRIGSLSDFAAIPASGSMDLESEAGEDAGGDGEIDWLSAVGDDLASLEVDFLTEDEDGEYEGLVSGGDEVGTKLDLAKAYIDMGDAESALSILDEVGEDASEDQRREAEVLRSQLG